MPAEKARSSAPVRMIARTFGPAERTRSSDVVEILDMQGVTDLRAVKSDPANPVVVVNKRQSHS